jgi:hypothetical protein
MKLADCSLLGCDAGILIARYLLASLSILNTHVGGQPDELREGKTWWPARWATGGKDSHATAYGDPSPFRASLTVLLWRSPGSQIFFVKFSRGHFYSVDEGNVFLRIFKTTRPKDHNRRFHHSKNCKPRINKTFFFSECLWRWYCVTVPLESGIAQLSLLDPTEYVSPPSLPEDEGRSIRRNAVIFTVFRFF